MSQTGSYVSLAQDITTITGNTGGAVSPTAGNINIVGSGGVTVTGNPSTHTLTVANGGTVALTYTTDSGNAVPALNVLDIFGTANEIATAGAGHAVTISVPSTFIAPGSIASTTSTTVGNALTVTTGGATITAGGLTVTAGNTTLTPLNAAGIVLNSSAGLLSTHATTQHAVQIGNATGQLADVSVGATGTVLAGNTGADPTFQALTGLVVTSIAGTANEITASASTGAVTLSIPSTFIAPGTIQATTTSSGLTLATTTATNNLQLNGNTITASGSNANVDVDITTKGTGALVFRGLTSGFSAAKWVTAQADLQTLDATPTNIISIAVAAQEMVTISVFCNGFTSDFATCLGGNLVATAYRPTGGNVAIVGAPSGTINYTNLSNGNNITIAVDTGAQALNVICTGVAATTYNWVATYSYMYLVNNL